jgi:hypothetical protein
MKVTPKGDCNGHKRWSFATTTSCPSSNFAPGCVCWNSSLIFKHFHLALLLIALFLCVCGVTVYADVCSREWHALTQAEVEMLKERHVLHTTAGSPEHSARKKLRKGNRSRKIYLPTRLHQGSAQDKLALAHVARDLEALVRQLSKEAQLFLQDVTLISRKTLHYTFILCLYYISATWI